jgi:hypothetical protein
MGAGLEVWHGGALAETFPYHHSAPPQKYSGLTESFPTFCDADADTEQVSVCDGVAVGATIAGTRWWTAPTATQSDADADDAEQVLELRARLPVPPGADRGAADDGEARAERKRRRRRRR